MRAICFAMTIVVMGCSMAIAAENGSTDVSLPQSSAPIPLLANGLWHYSATLKTTVGPDSHGGWMSAPAQDILWTLDAPNGATLDVVDAWMTGDRFEVYVDGARVLTTSQVPFFGAPEFEPDTPGPVPFEHQAALNAAFESTWYSRGTVAIAPGIHLINMKDLRFPPDVGGAGFALRATPVRQAVGERE